MMRATPGGAAVAVRAPDGTIVARRLSLRLLGASGPWRRPVLRGAATLVDTLRLGLSAISWSSDIAMPPKEDSKTGGGSSLPAVLGILLAVVLFGWMPLFAAMQIVPGGRDNLWINLLAGIFRVAAFFGYIAAISVMPSIRRVFTFHGAEHQTIHAWEHGAEPFEPAALAEKPMHARCGTSFTLLVMLLAILFYALVDTGVTAALGHGVSAHWRILYHLPLMPLVLGISYEILRAADKRLETSVIARAISAPGLLLQRMTTRRAGAGEIAVAAAALNVAAGLDPGPAVRIVEEEHLG
jgi:uncharacterized protein YqhQ